MVTIRQVIAIKDSTGGNDGSVTVEIVSNVNAAVLASATKRSLQVTVVEQTAKKSGRWEYQLPKVQDVAKEALDQLQRVHDEAEAEMRRQGLIE